MSDQPHDPKALESGSPQPEPEAEAEPEAPRAEGRRLYRSRTDRVIGGVCGGLGEYFDVDPVLFRIGWAVFALMGGIGAVAYLAAYLIMPERDVAEESKADTSSPSAARRDRSRNLGIALGVVLILLGFNFLINEFDLYIFPLHRLDLDFEFLSALAFIGLGAYLVLRKPRGETSEESSAAGTTAQTKKRRLTRSRRNRKIAGICGGLAEYFNLDATLVRVVFVVLALGTHLLVALIYAIMIAVVPEAEPESQSEGAESPS